MWYGVGMGWVVNIMYESAASIFRVEEEAGS
jgi:hypothetical protein